MIEAWVLICLIIGVAAFLIAGALSPVETMSWWAGWSEGEIELSAHVFSDGSDDRLDKDFCVYLSGVVSISGNVLMPRERNFIRRLRSRMPDVIIVTDVFPFSPKGKPLLRSPRLFSFLWKWLYGIRISGKRALLPFLINLRNVYQVMVSADARYGAIFNFGEAEKILAGLERAGYPFGSGKSVAILAYSGGAQVAVGATAYLSAMIGAPVSIVAIGGVMASVPGVTKAQSIYCLRGTRDHVEKVGAICFPERWPTYPYSEWNLAKNEGKIKTCGLDEVRHDGRDGYLGETLDKDGRAFVDITVDVVVRELFRIYSENSRFDSLQVPTLPVESDQERKHVGEV